MLFKNAEELKKLRGEITLCSLFINDYENSFGIDPESCCDFFDAYAEYLAELMTENNVDSDAFYEVIEAYDTAANLWDWYNCYEFEPFKIA